MEWIFPWGVFEIIPGNKCGWTHVGSQYEPRVVVPPKGFSGTSKIWHQDSMQAE